MTEKEIKAVVGDLGNKQGCVVFSTFLDDKKHAVTRVLGDDNEVAQMVASIIYETADIFDLTMLHLSKMKDKIKKRQGDPVLH